MENDNACVEDMMIAIKQSIDERCGLFFQANEKIELLNAGSKLAKYECFLQKFEQWCSSFIQY